METTKKHQHGLLLHGVAFEDRMMQSCCSEMVKTDHFMGLGEETRKKIHELLTILADDSVRHKALIEQLAAKYHE